MTVIELSVDRSGSAKNAVDLRCVLKACRVNEDLYEDSRSLVPYLSRYVGELKAKLAVIEPDYIDRDYLDDFTRYYARCFREHRRTCHRVHFFRRVYSSKELGEILSAADGQAKSKVEALSSDYLGFVVLRPLPRTIVGRTCLLPYPEKGYGRHYRALRNVSASFFGRQLSLRCMPFQQQDSATAACATCALWSAFQVTSELFGHKTYCPGCVTSLAVEHGLDELRSFPNGGLSLPDMIYAIRKVGLDPICVDERMLTEPVVEDVLCNPQEIILGNLYAYLEMGIPVIMACELTYADGAPYGDDGHAVTVNGYRLINASGHSGDWLKSSAISELYVHDDQIGPSARITVTSGTNTRWQTDWKDRRGADVYFSSCHLLIPAYEKIRVSFSEVYEQALVVSECVKKSVQLLKEDGRLPDSCESVPKWDIRLQTGVNFKNEVRNFNKFDQDRKLDLLTKGFPKYVWNVSISVNGIDHVRFVLDATDGGQGLSVLEVIFHSQTLWELWAATSMSEGEGLEENVLFTSLSSLVRRL